MSLRTRASLIALAALGSVLVSAPAASAEERTCRGSIGATTLDNVRVPAGATCTLTGTLVKGTLKVETGATLYASRIRVVGNVQAEGHRYVRVHDSRVGGSIQLTQGGALDLRRDVVTGDIQLFTNTSGAKYLYGNRVDGNLQCKENRPAPVGSGNIVQGNKEDQCARL
ncbi:hypothetical protein GCM10023168_29860 [Fodinibacter luteus]|uniref:DUF3060 domain-containing protein n=1 Tax=Fodinibacter luteus TaxID=552064 RepID=A0ABP8KLP0_9MICO